MKLKLALTPPHLNSLNETHQQDPLPVQTGSHTVISHTVIYSTVTTVESEGFITTTCVSQQPLKSFSSQT